MAASVDVDECALVALDTELDADMVAMVVVGEPLSLASASARLFSLSDVFPPSVAAIVACDSGKSVSNVS